MKFKTYLSAVAGCAIILYGIIAALVFGAPFPLDGVLFRAVLSIGILVGVALVAYPLFRYVDKHIR